MVTLSLGAQGLGRHTSFPLLRFSSTWQAALESAGNRTTRRPALMTDIASCISLGASDIIPIPSSRSRVRRQDENHIETDNQPQQFWICVCCRKARKFAFVSHRRNRILSHIRVRHTTEVAEAEVDSAVYSSKVDYVAPFVKSCGFCGHVFLSWLEHNVHIINHFRSGWTMERWHDPWPEDKAPTCGCCLHQ